MVMKSLEPGGFGNQLATGGLVQKWGMGNYDKLIGFGAPNLSDEPK